MTTTDKPLTGNGEHWRITYLFALLLVLIIAWPTLFFPFGRDQGIHATIGYALGEGLVTYSEVYNIKPPLTTAVHLLSQLAFGHSMWAIRALDLIFALMTSAGLVSVVQRSGLPPVAGAFTAFGFVLIYYSQSYWTISQTDGWAGFLVVAAVNVMLAGWARPGGGARAARMGLAGALLGLAFTTKYTIGGAGILVFAPLLFDSQARFRPFDFLAVTAGGFAAVACILLFMLACGAIEAFFEVQNFLRHYAGYESTGRSIFSQLTGILGAPLAASAVVIGALVWLRDVFERRGRLFHAILLLWLISAAVSGLIQGKGFHYHFLPMVAPYALLIGLAGWRFSKLIDRLWGHRSKIAAALLTALLAIPSDAALRVFRALAAISGPAPVSAMRAEIPAGSDFDFRATLAFSDILSSHRSRGDRLFVWGYETMLYFLQNEPPRYRYPYSWPFIVDFYDGRYTADLMARLEAEPPKHIVVQKLDATPWVTGRDQSSKEFLEDFDPLSAFLTPRYELIEQFPRFELWEFAEQ